ncbi:hypothetical protein [Dyadobacter sp. 676]|uniref:MFS transporter n=1 Tax=Dyadobacter sp. 676 TaxID=3088362 RepID=A0AAU8FH65_9BACT
MAISVSHLLNDLIQSGISAIYPLLKSNYSLTFAQIGIITLAYQLTASILQPFVGSSIFHPEASRVAHLAFGYRA